MVVVAKIGIRGKGKVRTQEGIYEVKSADDGWLTVSGPPPEGPGSVRYLDERDLLEIERRGGTFSIHFRPELEQTRFELNGRVYEVATTDFGHISIAEGSRPVVRGHGTVSGVRLLAVAADLAPFERELAFGFGEESKAYRRGLRARIARKSIFRSIFPSSSEEVGDGRNILPALLPRRFLSSLGCSTIICSGPAEGRPGDERQNR